MSQLNLTQILKNKLSSSLKKHSDIKSKNKILIVNQKIYELNLYEII